MGSNSSRSKLWMRERASIFRPCAFAIASARSTNISGLSASIRIAATRSGPSALLRL